MLLPSTKLKETLRTRGLPGLVLVLLCLLALATTAWSQILPRTVEPERFEKRFEPAPVPRAQPRRPRLKPRPIPRPAPQKKEEVGFILKDVLLEGGTVYSPDRVRRYFRRFLGRRITVEHVNRMAEGLTVKYRNEGYILSQVVVPPQKIEDGVVRLLALEGSIAKIEFQGVLKGPPRMLKRFRKQILASRPLQNDVLERYLLLLNDQPGIRARSVLRPSADTPGEAELTIVLSHKPFDADLGLDNRGSSFNGPLQFSSGFSLNSLASLYEQFRFRGIITSQTDELRYFNASVDLPVSLEGTRLFLSGSVASSQPGGGLEAFEVDGDSTTFAFQVTHPVWRTRSRNLSATFGFGLINSETKIFSIITAKDRLRFLRAGLTYDFADRWRGINVWSARITQGLDLFGATDQASQTLTRRFGENDFTRFDGEVIRLQKLADRWNLLLSGSWQVSLDDLLASQEFTAGGPRFARGFDSSEIAGDSGGAMTLELQYNWPIHKKYLESVQPYVFFDYGAVYHKREQDRTEFFDDLYSTGLGVRGNFTPWLSGYLEMAKPINRIVASQGDKDPRVFFGLTARY